MYTTKRDSDMMDKFLSGKKRDDFLVGTEPPMEGDYVVREVTVDERPPDSPRFGDCRNSTFITSLSMDPNEESQRITTNMPPIITMGEILKLVYNSFSLEVPSDPNSLKGDITVSEIGSLLYHPLHDYDPESGEHPEYDCVLPPDELLFSGPIYDPFLDSRPVATPSKLEVLASQLDDDEIDDFDVNSDLILPSTDISSGRGSSIDDQFEKRNSYSLTPESEFNINVKYDAEQDRYAVVGEIHNQFHRIDKRYICGFIQTFNGFAELFGFRRKIPSRFLNLFNYMTPGFKAVMGCNKTGMNLTLMGMEMFFGGIENIEQLEKREDIGVDYETFTISINIPYRDLAQSKKE